MNVLLNPIKFINKNGTTRTTDPAFVAYDKENICQIKCSETDIITSSKPNTVNISKIANATSTNFIENYVGADDREKDTVNSFIIPKLILSEMYTTNVTFIKIYNAINDTKQRLFYVLSYNSSGDLVIDKSFSLDDTYSCPNYCDTVFYIFSNTVTK